MRTLEQIDSEIVETKQKLASLEQERMMSAQYLTLLNSNWPARDAQYHQILSPAHNFTHQSLSVGRWPLIPLE